MAEVDVEDGRTGEKFERKKEFFAKLQGYLEKYPTCITVLADNVGSAQMQRIRKSLRGQAVVLMGKNTMMRRAIKLTLEANPKLEKLLPHLVGNVGLVFTDKDIESVRQIIDKSRVGAPAKAGSIAPIDVIVPAGPTGMEPTQTSFLQALNIASKITKGQIEILSDVPLITKGQKVGPSEATLLAKLNIKPFSYGLTIKTVYDNGSVYGADVLDIKPEDIVKRFVAASQDIAAVSLAIGYPTVVSVPHSIIRGFKNVLAASLGSGFEIKEAESVRAYLANPSAFAAAPAAAPAAAEKKGAAPAAAEKKKPEPEPEGDDDMGFGLFD